MTRQRPCSGPGMSYTQEMKLEALMIVIAMTREIGSLGIDVSAGVADRLGLTIIDSEIVANNVAQRLGVKAGAVSRYVDGSASVLERWLINRRRLSLYTSEEILLLTQRG